MRIGVLGGTFDPPHSGHLSLARAAIEALQLDEVLFMPANRNPNKTRPPVATARQRLEMTQVLIEDEPKMAVSDLEISRPGPSYAVETLEELQFARPAEYWFLTGVDAAKEIDTWKSPEKLLRMCRLGVAARPPIHEPQVLSKIPEAFRSRVDLVPMKPIDVSAKELRDRLAAGRPVAPHVPERVIQYIQEHGLYKL